MFEERQFAADCGPLLLLCNVCLTIYNELLAEAKRSRKVGLSGTSLFGYPEISVRLRVVRDVVSIPDGVQALKRFSRSLEVDCTAESHGSWKSFLSCSTATSYAHSQENCRRS